MSNRPVIRPCKLINRTPNRLPVRNLNEKEPGLQPPQPQAKLLHTDVLQLLEMVHQDSALRKPLPRLNVALEDATVERPKDFLQLQGALTLVLSQINFLQSKFLNNYR